MNKHQDEHHGSHHQDHSKEEAQIEMRDAAIGDTDDRQSALDELEDMMFKRAR